jgi:type I restriction enzyme M protein
MFFTVTLPATLWFFDKDKQDDKILFMDARNVFTQVDRAHRKFSEEQVQNIAIITKLQRGKRAPFIRLIESYFSKGMDLLKKNQTQVDPVCEHILNVLNDEEGQKAVKDLASHWKELKPMQEAYQTYLNTSGRRIETDKDVSKKNDLQHKLREVFDPFFESLHAGLKQIDKIVRHHEKGLAEKAKGNGKRTVADRETKQLKESLSNLHDEVKSAESYFKHIHWLQDRFPKAEYEDVIGLCKLASKAEVEEQDYSLNPGRYVGVVIEEDGKTEEEFIDEMLRLNKDFRTLTKASNNLFNVIELHMSALVDENE